MKFIISIAGNILAIIRLILLISSMSITVAIGYLLVRLKVADQHFAFKIRTYYCRFALKILGVQTITSGTLNLQEGSLYVCNHRSFIDPLIAFAFINNGYVVSKAEVSDYPVIGTGAKLSGVLYVERNNSGSRHQVKESIEAHLRNKRSIFIFPEGTTSPNKELLPFKKGSFEAAATAGSPVICIAQEPADPGRDYWLQQSLLKQFFITFSKWRTTVYMHFFDPVYQTNGEEMCKLAEEMIGSKIIEFQRRNKK